MADEWKDLWQGQPPEGARIVAEVLRQRAEDAARKRRGERIGETLGIAALAAIAIGGIFAVDRVAQRVLFGIAVAWNLVGLVGVWHGLRFAAGDELRSCVAFCRAELQRRSHALRAVWLMRAGPVLLVVAAFVYPAFERNAHVMRMLPFLSMVGVWLIVLAIQQRVRMRAVDREIEELKNLEKAAGA